MCILYWPNLTRQIFFYSLRLQFNGNKRANNHISGMYTVIFPYFFLSLVFSNGITTLQQCNNKHFCEASYTTDAPTST